MTATGGTLLLPEVDEDQAVEVEYGQYHAQRTLLGILSCNHDDVML